MTVDHGRRTVARTPSARRAPGVFPLCVALWLTATTSGARAADLTPAPSRGAAADSIVAMVEPADASASDSAQSSSATAPAEAAPAPPSAPEAPRVRIEPLPLTPVERVVAPADLKDLDAW